MHGDGADGDVHEFSPSAPAPRFPWTMRDKLMCHLAA